MTFGKLTLDTLCLLQSQGFNILTSKSVFNDENHIWYADRLQDINEYLIGAEVAGMHLINECRILIVDDAITYHNEFVLTGDVFMWL